ncbi:MAG TPA: choice-of-anchor tandem repeat NxxGxxAF-containing protein [Blastocatellia bacterium]|nr:choice-of-anchor tandem repeat NxxGxxAF-containing protein [Blastocatellia bacterium]
MCGTRRLFFLSLIAVALLAVSLSARPLAQPGGQEKAKGNEPKPQGQKKEQDDGPVAITERSRGELARPEPPKLEPGQIGVMGFPDINNKGEVAFWGRFISPDSPQGVGRGIFVKSSAGLRLVVRDGDKAVNLDEPLTDFSNPTINENSELVFIGTYGHLAPRNGGQTGGPTVAPGQQPQAAYYSEQGKSGIFIRDAKGLRLLAEMGQEVPRMPSHFSNLGNPSFNSKGMLTFVGTYVDPDGRGLFYLDSTQNPPKLSLLVRSGQPSVAEGRMVYSEHFYPSALNERGEVAFFVRLGDSGGIFVKREKGVELVAQQGREAPVPEGRFIGFGNLAPSISNRGDVAFVGFFDGPNAGRGLFVKEADKEGPARLLVRTKDPVGDTGAEFSGFSSPAINARGEVAFIGFYGGRTRGIFVKTAKGVQIIARAEDPVPGTEKDVFNNFASVTINDQGQVVFYGQVKNTATIGLFIWDAEKGLRYLVKRGDRIADLKVAQNK